MRKRRFTGLCAALGLTAAAVAASTPTAQAAPATVRTGVSISSYSDCPRGWFCAYEHRDGLGRMARFQKGAADLRDFNLNDQISSVFNNLGNGQTFCTFLDINFNGATWLVGNWRGNTAQYHRDENISSLALGCF